MSTIRLGPNFENEIRAAGLIGLAFSWGADGVFFPEAPGANGTMMPILTPDQVAAVVAVVAAHDPTKPDPSAQAAAALDAGIQIASTGTPALDGTYAIDAESQQKVAAIALYIAVNGRFPAGQATLVYPDIAGAAHGFASTAAFQAFATALADYVAAIDEASVSGGSMPAQPVTIP